MGTLEIRNLWKSFGDVPAVKGFNLRVEEGEFVALLGPSGCGKTTTLRSIAGFEDVDVGRILIGGRDVTQAPPHTRNTGMVFQNYALFPHMTVFSNVAFGLQMRKVPRQEIRRRVARALETVRLPRFEDRKPHQLSGGQQQRVALARALVIEPEVLLLDEPLSNLDAKLREEMRIEVRQIQKDVGITTVFVTHDQEEALVMSDRMVLMNLGEVVGQGTPIDLFEKPSHPFVASFLGQSNRIEGRVAEVQGPAARVRTSGGMDLRGRGFERLAVGDPVVVFVKCCRIRMRP
ncbi:MAG: ABC transporter ATP-binding protein, partial [Armatimonadetes bacterium]|nr:ABC transporter ATP-binding protein [Armatimonadota bacterium]